MKKIVLISCAALLGAQLFTSCKKTSVVPNVTREIVLPENGSLVINASNQFAFNFLQATLQQDATAKNKLISPLSIYLALGMVYNGADNTTKEAMANTLLLSGIAINNLNAVCKSLIEQLPKEDNHVQLSIANSIWNNKNNAQPLISFIDTTKNYFDATVQSLNFSDPNSVGTINNWVAQHTNTKITKIINGLDADDLIYLINAIYFDGSWKSAFNTSNTKNDNFFLQNGSTKSVPFMYQQSIFKFLKDDSKTIIELPYGGGKSFSMYVLLPNDQQQPISQFASLMNESLLSDAINKMDSQSVELFLPKWEYSYSIDDMIPALSSLGMGIAFTNDADFSKMYNASQTNAHITNAIHKTYIKVNEQGTEAAAVTALGLSGTSAQTNPIIKMNHPFLYAIIEKQTGAVLFIGTVEDPSNSLGN